MPDPREIETQDKSAKKDFNHLLLVGITSAVVLLVMLGGWWFPQVLPGGSIGAVMIAFVVVFAAIAWASLAGAEDGKDSGRG